MRLPSSVVLVLLLTAACGPDSFGSSGDAGGSDAAEEPDQAAPDDAGADAVDADDGGGQPDAPDLGYCASHPQAIFCADWDEGSNPAMKWDAQDVNGGTLAVVQTNPLSDPNAMEAKVSGVGQHAAVTEKITTSPKTITVNARFVSGSVAADFMRITDPTGTLTFSVDGQGVHVKDDKGGVVGLASATDAMWHTITVLCSPGLIGIKYDNNMVGPIGVGVTSGSELAIGIVDDVTLALGRAVDFDNVVVL